MRAKLLVVFAVLLAVMLFPSGCGTQADCPTCGTTKHGAYKLLLPIPVPEHNPTGEPGGPFNSFDISVLDSVNHRFFVSDRIGLDVVVIDTLSNVAVNFFAGANGVAGGGANASSCTTDNPNFNAATQLIPPIVSGLGNWTRFGCRTGHNGAGTQIITPAFHIPGFGDNNLFGGFPGAQCCAARANGVNPLSGPDGEVLSPDNKTLFIGNGSSSVVAFDLTSTTYSLMPGGALPPAANMIAAFPTGVSPDYDGPSGIAPCVASANGRAFSDPTCADLRADEMSIGVANGRTILLVANGDPGFPFVTLIDVTNIVKPTGTVASFAADHCLPVASTTPYGPVLTGSGQGSAAPAAGPINPPTCILGQIYYDGSCANNGTAVVDDVGLNATCGAGPFPCPDPSTTALSGMTGHGAGVNILGSDRPCHHGPQLITTVAPLPADQTAFCANQITPPGTCFGAVAIAGIGGSAFNTATGRFLVSNSSASATDLTYGTIDEIDPRVGNPNGPVVVASLKTPNCMPSGIVEGPSHQFLVGCADHDGETFPVNEYIVDCSANCKIIDTIDKVGGVDETWYNPGDNRYYLAARDMPDGPKMGVIDAGTHQWLVNIPTNSNSHSISVDSGLNHVFVPLQSGSGVCLTQSSNGCVGVYAQE